jgi:transposase InsO family protein
VLPAPHVPDGLTIRPTQRSAEHQGAEAIMPDNGKVERSHRSDQEEFYQLLDYTDDVDLNRKLADWESFYNFSRPHGASMA